MDVQIGNNVEYLTLRDIKPEYEGGLDFCKATLQLNVEGIKTNIEATIMLVELNQLLSDLKKLYGTLQHSFKFDSLEDNVSIGFTPTSSGHIDLEGYVRSNNYNSRVTFELTTDQTFLPETIKQLQEAIANLTTGKSYR